MSMLTGSQMRYLHIIYTTQTEEGIRCVDISRNLGVTMASVSRMVRLLADLGMTTLSSGKVTLTNQGSIEGKAIDEKLRRLKSFFSEYLKLSEHESTDSAYSFLCNFTDNCIDKLIEKDWTAAKQSGNMATAT